MLAHDAGSDGHVKKYNTTRSDSLNPVRVREM